MTIVSRSASKFWWKKEVPNTVHHYEKNITQGWKTIFWKDIFQIRTEKQINSLSRKRNYFNKKKHCYIHVFFNNTTFFGGWYIYIVTINKEWSINFRQDRNKDLIILAMELFPCGIIPMIENFEIWCKTFCKFNPKISKRRKNEGVKFCIVEIDKYNTPFNLYLK